MIFKCNNCGKFFDKSLGVCPFCGTVLDDIVEENNMDDTVLPNTSCEESNTSDEPDSVFVQCPVCKNKYDLSVGVCAICGYSSLEKENELHDKSEAVETSTQNDVVEKDKVDSGNENTESKQDKGHGTVRSSLLSYFENSSLFQNILGMSVVFAMIYPVCLILTLFQDLSGFSRFVHKTEDLLSVVFYIGIAMCFSKKQNSALAVSFGTVASYYFITIIKHINYVSFNELFSIGIYIALCVLSIVKRDSQPETSKKSTGQIKDSNINEDNLKLKRITMVVFILVAIIAVVTLIVVNNADTCVYCGKKIFGDSYSVFGEPCHKECFLNN